MKRIVYGALILFICMGVALQTYAAQSIIAKKVAKTPKIDGLDDDPEWKNADPLIVYENIGQLEITLKAVYTDKYICFLVTFPDEDESRNHRNLVWDKAKKMYFIGPEREDNFVFKWSMEPDIIDLSIYADNSYTTDIWYWKACRSDPMGFADDKISTLSMIKQQNAAKIISKKGFTYYSKRKGDEGKAAYQDIEIPIDFHGDTIPLFKNIVPSESRADIIAKGQWKDKKWSIEFKRLLFTGHPDDIQFSTHEKYQFGIARYEISGRKPNPKEKYYGAGDVIESLFLSFSK
jgi:hypothetical protein